jgi:hypothetical protein
MADEHEIPTTRAAFDRALSELRRDYARRDDNPESYRAEDCQRCVRCTFTTDSVDCANCTYCSGCESCTSCTHCAGCTHCHASSYCIDAEHLSECSYVVRSAHCAECVFCFGCVGLFRREFHILNRPFPRDVYFRILGELEEAGIAPPRPKR